MRISDWSSDVCSSDLEEEALAAERSDMQKGARLAGELTTVNELLLGSEGGLSQLRQAARRLDRMAAEHPLLAEALASLDRAVIEASEAEEKLDAASDACSFDPEIGRASGRERVCQYV